MPGIGPTAESIQSLTACTTPLREYLDTNNLSRGDIFQRHFEVYGDHVDPIWERMTLIDRSGKDIRHMPSRATLFDAARKNDGVLLHGSLDIRGKVSINGMTVSFVDNGDINHDDFFGSLLDIQQLRKSIKRFGVEKVWQIICQRYWLDPTDTTPVAISRSTVKEHPEVVLLTAMWFDTVPQHTLDKVIAIARKGGIVR